MRIYTHPSCLRHDPGAGHPEAPARLAAVLGALEAAFPQLTWTEAPLAARESLARAHGAGLLHQVLDLPVGELRRIDADTAMSSDSAEAALRAAGAVCAAIDAIMAGEIRRAFCAVRPPGHHATRNDAMGFCLFNSIAVGAMHAIQVHRLQRVAVVDFDVHHGNGTQEILWNEPRAMYVSSHQQAIYPGTGASEERGGLGRALNLPLPEGCDSRQFRQAWRDTALPALEGFRPEMILISAGFDGHRLDPLAGLNLGGADFEWVTHELVDIAQRHGRGRVVSALEGGYSLSALRESSVAHIKALL